MPCGHFHEGNGLPFAQEVLEACHQGLLRRPAFRGRLDLDNRARLAESRAQLHDVSRSKVFLDRSHKETFLGHHRLALKEVLRGPFDQLPVIDVRGGEGPAALRRLDKPGQAPAVRL